MTNITRWSENDLEHFSHKLEEIIHGPNGPLEKVGFIFVSFPMTDSAKAKLLSNMDRQVVVEVLYQILKGLVTQ